MDTRTDTLYVTIYIYIYWLSRTIIGTQGSQNCPERVSYLGWFAWSFGIWSEAHPQQDKRSKEKKAHGKHVKTLLVVRLCPFLSTLPATSEGDVTQQTPGHADRIGTFEAESPGVLWSRCQSAGSKAAGMSQSIGDFRKIGKAANPPFDGFQDAKSRPHKKMEGTSNQSLTFAWPLTPWDVVLWRIPSCKLTCWPWKSSFASWNSSSNPTTARVYPLVIKHGWLENGPLISDVPS